MIRSLQIAGGIVQRLSMGTNPGRSKREKHPRLFVLIGVALLGVVHSPVTAQANNIRVKIEVHETGVQPERQSRFVRTAALMALAEYGDVDVYDPRIDTLWINPDYLVVISAGCDSVCGASARSIRGNVLVFRYASRDFAETLLRVLGVDSVLTLEPWRRDLRGMIFRTRTTIPFSSNGRTFPAVLRKALRQVNEGCFEQMRIEIGNPRVRGLDLSPMEQAAGADC